MISFWNFILLWSIWICKFGCVWLSNSTCFSLNFKNYFFLIFFGSFWCASVKNNFFKIIVFYIDSFLSKKHFEKQLLPHFQTLIKNTLFFKKFLKIEKIYSLSLSLWNFCILQEKRFSIKHLHFMKTKRTSYLWQRWYSQVNLEKLSIKIT
jgi:hypothetical protein